jgi:nitrite reductase/ring-hydroxylating ferredoxin subunit
MRFVALEKLINLYDGYTRHCRVEFHDLLLVQRQGECFVLESRCPHREHALEAARIEAGVLECPLHGYRFSLRDGGLLRASEEPCRALRVWPVAYRGNEAGIFWEDDGL